MSDTILEPEGSIEINASRHDIPAKVTIYFVFDGDWSNMYDDQPDTEAEARQWFVEEVRRALEAKRDETGNGDQTQRASGAEDRGV